MLFFAATGFREGIRVARFLGISYTNASTNYVKAFAPYIAGLLAAAIVAYLSYLGYRKVRASLGKV